MNNKSKNLDTKSKGRRVNEIIRLPGIDGDAMILKAHEMMPTVHFIIYTGSVEYRLSEDLKRIGTKPEHVFLKPQQDLTVLVDAIQDLLRS